jgi:two-component system copper resistance phosphate regulon response regulator CusR
MKILIIEDDEKTAAYLRKGLMEAAFTVDMVHSGLDGRHQALTEGYDLIVMDIMLPDLDGWRILASLRQAGNATPVLLLTARDSVEDRVHGLEMGADDYLVKPFAFAELLARIRNILRRGVSVPPADILQVADLEIDLKGRKVVRAGKVLTLTTKEFALLELLVRHQGEVLPRSMIASQIWDMNFDSDTNVIDVAIRRLRAKIDEGQSSRLIHTVRGMGYKAECLQETTAR